jgi:hypothetical protein
MNIFYGILWGVIAQLLTFMQLQGHLKYEFFKNNTFLVILLGIPISYMYMQSVKYYIEAFDGQIWPARLIGFSTGVIIFAVMASLLFKEPITIKTGVCLGLGLLIILVQIFYK